MMTNMQWCNDICTRYNRCKQYNTKETSELSGFESDHLSSLRMVFRRHHWWWDTVALSWKMFVCCCSFVRLCMFDGQQLSVQSGVPQMPCYRTQTTTCVVINAPPGVSTVSYQSTLLLTLINYHWKSQCGSVLSKHSAYANKSHAWTRYLFSCCWPCELEHMLHSCCAYNSLFGILP